MGLSELTGLPRRKCKDVLQCKEVLKHRGTENTEEGGGSSVACLVAASRWHPWHKAQGWPERGRLRRSYLFNARFSGVRRAKSSKRDITDKNEPEALADFVRLAKNRLAPQAHENEK